VLVAEAVGRALAERAPANTMFGLVGSGNFAVTRAIVDCGSGSLPMSSADGRSRLK